ncbi:hypothetical protein L2B51_003686, partial [Acinetobacter baumannii]|nr:hypothetical protein [Acinetobacter baumannii]EKY0570583.1 hypothetical protein [Acinetobacter baumannii]ELA8453347.1 hypothetical protein [Acinetobacter baumannii]ELB0750376.1 hypothetical protein [Acinetobacter baumannii]ELY7249007.1 hypothetical protein [Acinetobacter baumannii]
MDNYKIKVKDEAESKEAQELLKQLGFQEEGFTGIGLPCYLATWNGGYADYYFGSLSEGRKREELTLPQLRDLVVLKRNDVKDATHNNFRTNTPYLKQGENEYYMFNGEWVLSNCPNDLEPITKPQDPALISGADALRALADGKEVEANNSDFGYWIDARNLSVKDFFDDIHIFRLKPQTIKLELELPKPFEPEEDCHVYILDDGKTDGYRRYSYEVHGDKGNTFIGIWRTEEEI